MSDKNELISKCAEYVKSVFDEHATADLTYHNWEHTMMVHDAAKQIGEAEGVSQDELDCLRIAALFHDVAYYKGKVDHEAQGAKEANAFLTKEEVDPEQIAVIERVIKATRMGTEASDKLEQIIQDADLAHLGSEKYFETTFKNLLHEMNSCGGMDLKEHDWKSMSLKFMRDHQFKTKYAQENFTAQKDRNIETLKAMLETDELDKIVEGKTKKGRKKKNKVDSNIPEKGIETMFRVTLRNHVNLSRIADNKANTLISVNAIIISIVLSTMFPKMDTNPYIIYPGLSLIIFSIITIIISILSTIPKTTHGKLTREQVINREGNLIFFGNFHSMSLDDYEWGIGELMRDKEYLYKSLTRDLYFLGKVLNRKYVLLRYSYYTFVIGLIVSIVLFLLSIPEGGVPTT
ncbi:Pycsar system effector family protein [Sanyastnella coralliicola]|uniref:Pycsar system effector family protein n=1 Tax=Sanyastnella coralliicola TaxID=3069118 RepID=UPI0027BADB29|nr:Pycsar system effector family protein [Longitalea sp. SCSIO 12813]